MLTNAMSIPTIYVIGIVCNSRLQTQGSHTQTNKHDQGTKTNPQTFDIFCPWILTTISNRHNHNHSNINSLDNKQQQNQRFLEGRWTKQSVKVDRTTSFYE